MALPKKNEAEKEVETVVETTEAAETETTSEAAAPETEVESILEEPEAETEPVAEATGTGVAAPAGADATMPTVAVQQNKALGTLAESGFAGLDIDWTSFPTVVLDNGEFCTADGTSLETKQILVRLVTSKKRFVLRTKVADPENDEPELAYTYNLAELQDPESELAQKVLKWKTEDDLDYDIKEYIEAIAVVEDEDSSLNEQMVLLQIPPTARGKFSGYVASNQLVKKELPGQYITRCYAGAKVTKTKKPFVPWAFEYIAG